MVCPTCGREIQPGVRFCSGCGQPAPPPPYVPVHEAAAQAGLVRPLQGRVIAGVCAGFARRYGWDPVVVRLVLVLCFFVAAGTPVLAYVVAWIVMPNEPWVVPMQTTAPPPPPNPTVPPTGTMGV